MARQSRWIFCLMLAAGVCRSGEKPIPYISPGLRIGYEFGNGFSFGAKISLGIYTDPGYYNITLGVRAVSHKKPAPSVDEYNYIEFQAGYPNRESWGAAFLGGAGAGIVFLRDRGIRKIKPIFNLSYGLILFLDADIIPLDASEIKVDVGTLAVLPFPLKRVDFFGDPGGSH
jgi:hypothetical protein